MLDYGMLPHHVICLDVDDGELIARVVGRRQDPETGIIYHLLFNPPPSEEIARRLKQRPDDNEAVAKKRLATYHDNVTSMSCMHSEVFYRLPHGLLGSTL